MKRTTIAAILSTTVLGVVVAGLGIPLSQGAQSTPPTNPNILAAVQQVQTTLNSMATALGSSSSAVLALLKDIQTKVNNLQPKAIPNTRVTPPLFVSSNNESPGCFVVNASSTPKHVSVGLIGGPTGDPFPPFVTNFLLNPGQVTGGSGFTGAQTLSCKFTVLDGTRDDIRGSLVIVGPDRTVTLSAE